MRPVTRIGGRRGVVNGRCGWGVLARLDFFLYGGDIGQALVAPSVFALVGMLMRGTPLIRPARVRQGGACLTRACIRDCRRCRRASQVGQVAFRRLLLEQRAEIRTVVKGIRSHPEHKEFDPVGRVAVRGGGYHESHELLLPPSWGARRPIDRETPARLYRKLVGFPSRLLPRMWYDERYDLKRYTLNKILIFLIFLITTIYYPSSD
jgi:hypothetical protein